MAEKPYRWTVDVEYDWGGRTNGVRGISEGLPEIIKLFDGAGIKALFFISTELLEDHPDVLKTIREKGHRVGSHGHFHQRFKESFRRQADKDLSLAYLEDQKARFRAPKFYWQTEDIYSNPKNHVSLLKHLWLGQKIKEETIMYLHPFDIVETAEPPPNLFCKLWYSQPKKASQLLSTLVNRYK